MIDSEKLKRQCPICDSTSFNEESNWKICVNGCSSLYIYKKETVMMYKVFNKMFIRTSDNNELLKEINYWRENDRYLTRIMSNE